MRPGLSLALLILVSAAGAGLAAAAPVQPQPAASFMAEVAKRPGVVTLPSGLAYHVEASGPTSGASPRLGDQVRVTYEGRLADGQVFDSSAQAGGPVVMTVGQLVPGWNEALQRMRPGDDWTLYLPPSLGYGDQQTGPIPPGSVMVFRLKLLDVAAAPAP